MKRLILTSLAFLSLSLFQGLNAQSTTWNIDKTHSTVSFTVTHMMVSEVDGSFKTFDGSLTTDNPEFKDSKITFTVDINSINTDQADRDKHLKSDDFFNAEKYPKATFTSTSFKSVGKGKFKVTGNLTLRDVTKVITFDVVYKGTAKDPYGNTKAGFVGTTTINRLAFGLKWNTLAEAGPMVSDEVELKIKLELVKGK